MTDRQLEKFAERLRTMISSMRYSVHGFANEIGHTRSNRLLRATKGETEPTVSLLMDIANRFPEVNIDWLVTGRGTGLIGGKVYRTEHHGEPVGEREDMVEEDEPVYTKKDLEALRNELKAEMDQNFKHLLTIIKVMHDDPGLEGMNKMFEQVQKTLE